VPADGLNHRREAELDESMVTGESRPVAKGPGDRVGRELSATDSPSGVRVEAVGEDTALARIHRLVAEPRRRAAGPRPWPDRFAALLFYVAVGSAAVTFFLWACSAGSTEAVVRTVTVLVIACPHALGLAIPL